MSAMRPDAARVIDILECAQAIVDRFAHHSFETLKSTPDAVKATFYDVIVIGAAMRDLVAKKDSSGNRIEDDSEIVKANPEIPWVAWIGMRDMVTHQYYRAAPEIVWRDYEGGEITRLIECCKAWVEADPES
jgi:uncharacterized protein with HEPN domain